jgi:hypothetical protein
MIRRMVPTTCSACLACNSEVGTKFHINGTFRRDSTHGSRPLPSVVFRASRGAAELTQNGFWEMGARLSQEVAVGTRARSSITNCRRSCSESGSADQAREDTVCCVVERNRASRVHN